MRVAFDWDPVKAAGNVSKHGISFEEAMTVFRDPLALSIPDLDSQPGEERWVTIGEAAGGNLLIIVHTWSETAEGAAVRIISARKPTRNEARQYREEA
ncbi:MAG TPA: BrnT family toxin [Beijerinckiaceae bacterium]|nr:BrnT family toxin [Beijerinckiaceae bacterium]